MLIPGLKIIISNLDFKIKSDIVDLVSVEKAENPNYIFLNLEVNDKGISGDFDIDYGENSIKYNINKKELDSENHFGFSSSDVLCLITGFGKIEVLCHGAENKMTRSLSRAVCGCLGPLVSVDLETPSTV